MQIIDKPTDKPTEKTNTVQVLQMTRAEWKATHRDSKGVHRNAEGKITWRSALHGGLLYPVEIVD